MLFFLGFMPSIYIYIYIFEGTCSEINHPNFLLRWLYKNIRIIQALDNFIELNQSLIYYKVVVLLISLHKSKTRTIAFSWNKNTLYCQNTFLNSYNICFRFSKDSAIFINLNLFLSSSWYYFLSVNQDFAVIHNIIFSKPVV